MVTRHFLAGLALGGMLLLWPGTVQASLPQTLNYQGRLTLAGGAPLPDSTGNTAVFRLYDALSGGTLLWTETWNGSVATKSGLFNVVLGSLTPLTLPFDQAYWLEIQVNNDASPMTPRQPLTMAPYAFRARSLDAPQSLSNSASDSTLSLFNSSSAGRALFVQGSASASTPAAEVVNSAANRIAFRATGGSAGNGTGVQGIGAIGLYGLNAGTGTDAIWGIATGAGSRGLLATGDAAGLSSSATASGGAALLAYQAAGSYALRAFGNSRFDTGSVSFAAHVDFGAATITGWSVPLPVPMTLNGTAAFPAAVLTVTNNGDGAAITGYATLPGAISGPIFFTSAISAGVRGYSNVSNSAGVLGFSEINSTAGAGVLGIGTTGVSGSGRSDLAGSTGGSFDANGPNGTAVVGSASNGYGGNFSGLTAVAAYGNAGGLGLYVQNGAIIGGGATLNGLRYPATDGGAGQFLTTNGLGTLSFGNLPAPLVPFSLTSTTTSLPAFYGFNNAGGSAMLLSASASNQGVLAVKNGGSSAQTYGILSVHNGTGATRVAVLGASDPIFSNPSGPTGIYGYSSQGMGVEGTVNGASNTGSGLRGDNTSGTGFGVSAFNSAGSGAAVALSASSLVGTAAYLQGATGLAAAGTGLGLSVTASGASGTGILVQVSSTAEGLRATNNNSGGYALFADNPNADANLGAAAIFSNGPLKLLSNTYGDSSSTGSPAGLATISTPAGRIRFSAAKSIPIDGSYGPINCAGTVLTTQSTVMVSFMSNVVTAFATATVIDSSGTRFSVRFRNAAAINFAVNDQMNFVIINQ